MAEMKHGMQNGTESKVNNNKFNKIFSKNIIKFKKVIHLQKIFLKVNNLFELRIFFIVFFLCGYDDSKDDILQESRALEKYNNIMNRKEKYSI